MAYTQQQRDQLIASLFSRGGIGSNSIDAAKQAFINDAATSDQYAGDGEAQWTNAYSKLNAKSDADLMGAATAHQQHVASDAQGGNWFERTIQNPLTYVLPGIGLSAGGMGAFGSVGGAGAAGAAEGAGAIAPWGAGEAVSGAYPGLEAGAAAGGGAALPNAGMDFGMYNPGQANPYVTGASGADAAAATNTAAAAGGGAGAGTGVGTAAGSASAISRIFAGNGTPADYASIIGAAAPAALGAYAANKQTGAYSDLAAKLAEYGAPSRARYEGSFAPGFSMGNDPGFTDALNQAGKASMHALSTFGNPAGSPNAWAQSQSDLYSKFAYPALQTYRNQNANAGGISALTTAAPSATTAAIGSQGNVYNSIGAGISDIFNPPATLAQTLAQYQRMLRGA